MNILIRINILALSISLFISFYFNALFASDLTSSVGFQIYHDNASNSQIAVTSNIELPSQEQLGLNYAYDDNSDSALDTRSYGFHVSTNPYESFSIRAQYQYWGKSRTLETDSFKNEFTLALVDWSISVSPQLSSTEVYLNLPANTKLSTVESLNLRALGIELAVSYFGWENFYLSANYFKNQYNDSVFFDLPAQTRQRILSNNTRSLASSIEDQHLGFQIGRFFQQADIALFWSKSNSSLFDLEVTNLGFSITRRFFSVTDLTVALSYITDNQVPANSTYGAQMGINYYW